MTSIKAPTSKRYFLPATGGIKWLVAIAAANFVPTLLELNATTTIDLAVPGQDSDVQAISGFTTQQNFATMSQMGSRFAGKMATTTEVADSYIDCYASIDGVDITSVLAEGDNGFVAIAPGGFTASAVDPRVMNVYPATIASISPQFVMDNADLRRVSFSITHRPAMWVAVPTA